MAVSPLSAADHEVFEAGDFVLQSGRSFPGFQLAYQTYGRLNEARDNAILYPTSFGVQHSDTQWLIRPGGILDPERYFILIPNLFCNGLSSSPSNATDRFSPELFPTVSYHDAVAVQRRLLSERFGISRLALVYGWSMGAMQAYHWAALYPEMVARVAIVCGSARCSPLNFVFLEGVKAALKADPAFQDGRFVGPAVVGSKAMGRVYAGWAMSRGFYCDELWREAGFDTLEGYLSRVWDRAFAHRDPNNLLAQIAMWQTGDISNCPRFGGDLGAALASITARVLLMPSETDAYFRPEDNACEIAGLTNARSVELCPIRSKHGHRAGNPNTIPTDEAFLRRKVAAFLDG